MTIISLTTIPIDLQNLIISFIKPASIHFVPSFCKKKNSPSIENQKIFEEVQNIVQIARSIIPTCLTCKSLRKIVQKELNLLKQRLIKLITPSSFWPLLEKAVSVSSIHIIQAVFSIKKLSPISNSLTIHELLYQACCLPEGEQTRKIIQLFMQKGANPHIINIKSGITSIQKTEELNRTNTLILLNHL